MMKQVGFCLQYKDGVCEGQFVGRDGDGFYASPTPYTFGTSEYAQRTAKSFRASFKIFPVHVDLSDELIFGEKE